MFLFRRKISTHELVWILNIIISVGMLLNTIALVTAGRHSTRTAIRSRTNVHYLVFHLTLADAITCFITIPMETAWRLAIEVSFIQAKI